MARLAAILSGKHQTPPDQLFQPLKDADDVMDLEPCGLVDPLGKELYSFSQELVQSAGQIPFPRNMSEIESKKHQVGTLTRQARNVQNLFWNQVRASCHEVNVPSGTICVRAGWKIYLTPDEESSENLDPICSKENILRAILSRINQGE
ncbi:MAG: hypothetical protein WC666_03480 [Candidatus Paceibacterota bacterium]|jgi:hypothetical protein